MGVKLGVPQAGRKSLTVTENGVLREMFGPERDKLTGEWRRLRNKELHDLCSSPNIMGVNKSIKMG
jgi:hypothetical protein